MGTSDFEIEYGYLLLWAGYGKRERTRLVALTREAGSRARGGRGR